MTLKVTFAVLNLFNSNYLGKCIITNYDMFTHKSGSVRAWLVILTTFSKFDFSRSRTVI